MGNSTSDISEDCKYYVLCGDYMLTVCKFHHVDVPYWFKPTRLTGAKLLSIQDSTGKYHKSLGDLKVHKGVQGYLMYYSTEIAARSNIGKYCAAPCRQDLVLGYRPHGDLFILQHLDYVSQHTDVIVVDTLRPGVIIADKINGKFKLKVRSGQGQGQGQGQS